VAEALGMEMREKSYRSSVQGGRRWRRSGMDYLPHCCNLFLFWKSATDLSHPRRRGNGQVDPAVHVLVSREPRRPLCTVIKEIVPVISHPCVGRVVKRCQRPGRAAGGPTIRLVPSESGHSCRGWRNSSRKHIVSNDAILWAS
jgi:hypothetical protein